MFSTSINNNNNNKNSLTSTKNYLTSLLHQLNSSSDSTHFINQNLISDLIHTLNHSNDEDKPDSLKAALIASPVLHPLPSNQIDSIVLQLLHAHRDDTLPNHLSISTTIKQPTLTRRITSFNRRTCPSSRPTNNMNHSNQRPFLSRSMTSYQNLNATATEFKPSYSRPITNTQPLTSNTITNTVWAFSPSPLGTPKFQPAPTTSSLETRIFNTSDSIPRHPWLVEDLQENHHHQIIDTASQPIVSCPSALEWGLSPAMADEMSKFECWDSNQQDQSIIIPLISLQSPKEEEEEEQDWNIRTQERFSIQSFDDQQQQEDLCLEQQQSNIIPRHRYRSRSRSPANSRNNSINRSSSSSSLTRPHYKRNPSRELSSSPNVGPRLLSSSTPNSPTPIHRNNIENQDSNLRVCRFYLQGSCLRSDCKFSHEVGKAVCRFWLRGHCLKGTTKCEFLHEIPEPITPISTNITPNITPEKKQSISLLEEDFPSLSESNKKSITKKSMMNKVRNIKLREPLLLPKGFNQSEIFKKVRINNQSLISFERMKECIERAQQCDIQNDSIGSKRWLKESEEWNKRLNEEKMKEYNQIILESNRTIKDLIINHNKQQTPPKENNEIANRMNRGKEIGGGICLGVISGNENGNLKERMEVLIDLHALKDEEQLRFGQKFLTSLKLDGYEGLAFIIISSSCSDNDNDDDDEKFNKIPSKLEHWLLKTGYQFQKFNHILCIDPVLLLSV
ncbi:hypothetical protein CROQUDRAFT_654750 [Cronartium quercuum f. sp. fusiforme G11]|uniref:C3H1-type domain-containing protein n=1 Tax=Cronartium quercuum f. sp. fusiforme G11 TaxID=708437 RepID=A0A9P6TE50_9BASI|nr:hypothetical protein CROQUDRAFT_654750 [Cronartium quercuum f. sp. fusiforme G11]